MADALAAHPITAHDAVADEDLPHPLGKLETFGGEFVADELIVQRSLKSSCVSEIAVAVVCFFDIAEPDALIQDGDVAFAVLYAPRLHSGAHREHKASNL